MQASQQLFNEYYRNCNVYSEAEALRNGSDKSGSRFSNVVSLLESVAKNKDISVIDVGCGGGELLRELEYAGFKNIVGLDPSEKSIEHIKKLGIRGICGNIFDKTCVDEKYDVVISMAVIEHIYELKEYINKMKSMLKGRGYIVLNAPAVEGFFESMLPIANNFNQEHINFFSVCSLDNLMGCFGMERCNESPYKIIDGEKQIIAIYRIDSAVGQIKKDEVSYILINKYLDLYKSEQERQDKTVEEIIRETVPIVIFGAGSYTKQLVKKFPLLAEKVLFYVDNNTNKQGTAFGNRVIESPERLSNISGETVILICSMKNSNDIRVQIKRMGISNRIIII